MNNKYEAIIRSEVKRETFTNATKYFHVTLTHVPTGIYVLKKKIIQTINKI